jgi:hypothetical protein
MSGSPRSKNSRRLWYLLLIVPFVATVFPQFYASDGPSILGIPFFYWYQIAWTALSGVVTGIVYFATR